MHCSFMPIILVPTRDRTSRIKQNDSEPGIEQPTFEVGGNDSQSIASDLYEQSTVVEGINDQDNDSESESDEDDDEDDDDLEYTTDPIDPANVSLQEKSLGAVSDASDVVSEFEQRANKSFSSIYQSEDETDGLTDHRTPTTTIYRCYS